MFGTHVVNRRWLSIVAILLAALLMSVAAVTAQGPQPQGVRSALGSGFTYQGQLKKNSGPVNDTCSMTFSLWDSQSNVTGQVGGNHVKPSVSVVNGLFTVVLNDAGQFGPSAFNGQARWLQAAVQCTGDGAPVALSRQPVTAAPYALYATGNWGLNGNAGTTANNFVGTTDNMSLTLRVSNTAALRLVPVPGAPVIIGGYSGNRVGGVSDGATIAGGGSDFFGANLIDGSNVSWSTIGGGVNNGIFGNAYNATIAGGYQNVISGTVSDAGRSVIGGGYGNQVNGQNATIAGGESNQAIANYSTVSGGQQNTASGYGSTIGGGITNTASLSYTAIAGGQANSATGAWSFVGGGFANTVGGTLSTVDGGYKNTASATWSTVSGGFSNTVSGQNSTVGGGVLNSVSGYASTVGGGLFNRVSADFSTVSGGYHNAASGSYSFAAGSNAKANHDGAFVWADFSGFNIDFPSGGANQFAVRATGGISLVTSIDGSGNPTTWCAIPTAGAGWSCTSDRNAKLNFQAVDARAVLAALATIPVETWSYKTQDASIRHIGPMAQDFRAAFGVGEDERTINSIDAQGVALAAIQGLYQVVQEKDARIAALEASNAAQQQQLADVQARLSVLEAGAKAQTADLFGGLPLSSVQLGVIALLLVQRRKGGHS